MTEVFGYTLLLGLVALPAMALVLWAVDVLATVYEMQSLILSVPFP